MEEIIESKYIDGDKSTLHVDLVKHRSGKLYVELGQTMRSDGNYNVLKLNPTNLKELIGALQNLQQRIPKKNRFYPLSDEREKQLVSRYLKGVPLKDLTIQFRRSQNDLKKILTKHGIEIVPFKMPRYKRWKRKKK